MVGALTLGLPGPNDTKDSVQLPDSLAGKFSVITVSGYLTQKLITDTTAPVSFGPHGWNESNWGCARSAIAITSGSTLIWNCMGGSGQQAIQTITYAGVVPAAPVWVRRGEGKPDCAGPPPCRVYTGSQTITFRTVHPTLRAWVDRSPIDSGRTAHFYVRWDVQPDAAWNYNSQINWIGWYWQNDGETTWTSMGCDGSTDCNFGPTRSGHAEYRYQQEGSDTLRLSMPVTVTSTRCPTPGDALLQNTAVVNGLRRLWDSSYVYRLVQDRRESGGIAYWNGSDTVFTQYPNLNTGAAAVCELHMRYPATITPLAFFHTHEFLPDERIPGPYCGIALGDTSTIAPRPSQDDAAEVQTSGVPGYVMDGASIYRLIPGFGTHMVGDTAVPNDVWRSSTYLTTYSRGPSCHYP